MSQNYHSLSDSDLSDNESGNGAFPHFTLSSSPCRSNPNQSPDKASTKAAKLTKNQVKEDMKYILPATCLNYITVAVEESIANNEVYGKIFSELSGISNLNIVNSYLDSICWTREVPGGLKKEENHILIIWDHIEFLNKIKSCTVTSFFLDLKKLKPHYGIYLTIYGLKDYCKRLKNKSKLTLNEINVGVKPSRVMIENLLCDLQLTTGVSHRLIDDPQDLLLFITQITKSVAEEPYKLSKGKKEREKTWYIEGNSRSCVNIDRDNNGLKRLWEQQLAQLPLSSLDYAKGISAIYPSPYSLYKAYSSLNSNQRENMLQNITIGRDNSKKRVGPEMSKKISLLFSSKYDFNYCA